jgi:teichuronic acid biosynthesis glycosyltransferase TuaG
MSDLHRGEAPSATRVSVIMPIYNARLWLSQAIESVLCQSHRALELIAIDDGSTDGSGQVVDQFLETDPRVVVIHQQNAGVAAARNAGLQAATGDYVAFLDADDWWHPEKLEHQLRSMQETGAMVSYTCYERIGPGGAVLSRIEPPRRVDWRGMLVSNRIGNLTGMYDRRLGDGRFQKIGHEDYVFWLEKVRSAGWANRAGTNEPLAFYRVSDTSLSSNKLRAAAWQWSIYRGHLGFSWGRSFFLMVCYSWHALAKRRAIS